MSFVDELNNMPLPKKAVKSGFFEKDLKFAHDYQEQARVTI